ncbi:SusC/RagA family TonB-linked outer membrane protein [Rapidithrix thailandica]|uniref:SusC/RagA family TonB-linked outer membrane protein n=1 Tax=Rapidithrix thailandica TaxID=413964 RepID=A0AAW9S7N1_9BACT
MKWRTLRLIKMLSKLTFYGMLVQCLMVNLLLANSTIAQKSVYQVRVSLQMKDTKLKEIFAQLEERTDFKFFYDRKKVNLNKRVDIQFYNAPLSDLLSALSKQAQVKFRQANHDITVSPYNTKLSSKPEVAILQEVTIKGKITDEDGEPLPGVSILIKGSTKGTTSDIQGSYQIAVPEDATLIFSYIGYTTQEIALGGQSKIDVIMLVDTKQLEEVVVVGYGTQKKVNLTGAVDQITSESLKNRPVSNVAQAIQGISPNLNISVNNTGGEPGATQNWNIRGIGTLTGDGGTPYILVDGVPMDINNVNPNDIESVSVLKDAASAAIYGSKGTYGVVLITTKKGRKGKKISFQYSNNLAMAAPIRLPEGANSLAFAEAYNTAALNSNQGVVFDDATLQRIRDYQAGTLKEEAIDNPDDPGRWAEWGKGHANYDWYDIFYRDWSYRQKHDIKVSGGTENTSFYLSGGFFDQQGQYKFAGDSYKRYNLTANINTQVSKWMSLDFNAKYARSQTVYPNAWAGYDRHVLYHQITRKWPVNPLKDPNGNYIEGDVLKMKEGGKTKRYDNDLWLTVGTMLEPVKGWKTNIRFNWNAFARKQTYHNKNVQRQEPNGTFSNIAYPITSFGESMSNDEFYLANITTSYERQVGSHFFKAMVGVEDQLKKEHTLSGSKTKLVTDKIPSISTATGEQNIGDGLDHYSNRGFFGRLNYNFKEKYLLELNARYDGSSFFKEGKRWGFFPSASIGYNISKEPFWQGIDRVVNDLKIRGSWGSLGNSNLRWNERYLFVERIPVGARLGWIMGSERPAYTVAPGIISNNLTWETATTIDIGMDATFLDSRLGLTFDWYRRTTSDMFGRANTLPALLGTSAPKENNATLETEGIELVLSWQDEIGSDFQYNVKVNLADNYSTITEYNNPTNILSDYRVGQRLGDIWGYTTAGYFQSDDEVNNWADQTRFHTNWGAGDIKYEDLNGDGKIDWGDNTTDDPGDQRIIGNKNPRYTYGLSMGASWKGFDLNVFFQGVGKRDIALSSNTNVYWGFVGNMWQNSVFDAHLDYWSPDNPNAFYPKPYMSGEHTKNTKTQTKYLENGAYMRLKNIQIGYTLPSSLLNKIGLENARVYFSGENLLTFTKLTKLFDPETVGGAWGSGKIYPLQKVLSMGVNVSF